MKTAYFFIALLQIIFAAGDNLTEWKKNIQKIVNGTKASYGDNIAMASLLWNGVPICGCSILNQYWLLTAAHCIVDEPHTYKVVTGAMNMGNYDDDMFSKDYEVSKVIVYPNYSSVETGKDLALIRTKTRIDYTPKYVGPAKLPKPGEDYCDEATVYGWGLTSNDGVVSDSLLKVTVPKTTHKMCSLKYGVEGYTIYKASQLCYALKEGGKDSCAGDSGGPLVCSVYPYYQIGIVSYGIGCAEADFPGVYTRVAAYYTWIEAKIKAYN